MMTLNYIKFNSIQFTLLIVGLLQVLLVIFTNRKKIHNTLLGFLFSFQSHLNYSKSPNNQNALVKKEGKFENSVSRGDLQSVLRNLGLFCISEKLPASFDANDISNLFNEKNVSLDEVKEAFDVFDKNGDGFIDATELQMVLYALGFQQGLDMENCRRMICAFDKDGDEKVDFDNFVKFMEITLS